jgi:hypothetical protein
LLLKADSRLNFDWSIILNIRRPFAGGTSISILALCQEFPMLSKLSIRLLLVGLIILGASLVFSAATAPSQASIYEEPNLGAAEAETLSIIVTAANSQQAARAVEAVGGTVTSELWLIEAVWESPLGPIF